MDGNVLVGPDSQLARDFQDYESPRPPWTASWSGSRMFKHMDRAYFIRNFAGIRPKRIDPPPARCRTSCWSAGTRRPAWSTWWASSPPASPPLPLARRAVALIARQEALEPNPDFDPIRHGIRRFADMTDEERPPPSRRTRTTARSSAAARRSPRPKFSRPSTTPGRPHRQRHQGAHRATMGRCQGGYCETRITEALRRELGEDFRDIHLGPEGSWMFTGSVKGGEPA
ncbi:MAG: hypothetical protein ACLRIS_05000 [Flavonifractor plautii]